MVRASRSDRGVSSVVGEVMLVAVTVLLAGATATMVIGLAVTSLDRGGGGDTLPDASMEFEVVENAGGPDELRVTHAGGDAIDGGSVYLQFDDAAIRGGGAGPAGELSWGAAGGGGSVDAGSEVVVGPPPGAPALEDLTLRVVWRDGGDSTVLATWDG